MYTHVEMHTRKHLDTFEDSFRPERSSARKQPISQALHRARQDFGHPHLLTGMGFWDTGSPINWAALLVDNPGQPEVFEASRRLICIPHSIQLSQNPKILMQIFFNSNSPLFAKAEAQNKAAIVELRRNSLGFGSLSKLDLSWWNRVLPRQLIGRWRLSVGACHGFLPKLLGLGHLYLGC